jgi:nucleotide-binding universal stress UspA family protein
MYRHILVPTDGSRVSEQAAAAAITLARSVGARVTALHVLPPPADPPLDSWAYGEQFSAKVSQSREQRGAMYVDCVREAARLAGVACECAIVNGASPSGAIVREARARGCDLIVMGSHGRRGAGDFAGSETLKVVALGGIPVLAHHPAWPLAAGAMPALAVGAPG